MLAPTLATGAYQDKFAMPGNFPGYGTLDLRGVAMREIRYLSFYNPTTTGYYTYPNKGRLRTGAHTTTDLLVDQTFEAAAVGIVIVRALTGTSHTITAVTPASGGATITVTPAFSPAPVDQEEYTYQMAGLTGTTTVTLPLGFGNLWDGNLTGLRLVCIVGANAGESRVIQSWTNSTRAAVLASAFTNPIGGTDTFEILPQSGTFESFAYWLPYTPFISRETTGKANPFPPGFDHPTHWSLPVPHNPNNAPSSSAPGAISYHVLLAVRLHEFFGEDIYMLTCDFGGTSLRRSENAVLVGSGVGWWDPNQQTHWTPGSNGGCYQRLMYTLQVGKDLATAAGDTLEVVGASFPQGESDSGDEVSAALYGGLLAPFKERFRADLVAMGLWPKSAERIPFIQPEIAGADSDSPSIWVYAAEINAAIRQEANRDRFGASFSVADIPHKTGDVAHYSGAGASMLAQRVFDAWRAIYQTGLDTGAVDICNMALSHIGQSAVVTAIDPPDGSAQAALCAQYYQQALEAVLIDKQMGFAMKRQALSPVTYTGLTQWRYAYQLPGDALKCVAVQSSGSTDDYTQPGYLYDSYGWNTPSWVMKTPQTFDIEEMPDGTRVIVSNTSPAVLRYVSRVTDTRKYSPLFKMAVSYQLAALLAGPVMKGDVGAQESLRLLRMADFYAGKAAAVDANQRDVRPEHLPDWLADR